ncbi:MULTISPECIES: hypothetical protein [unclassified Chryseobacterium]|uniref:hypothetical protein n=1 Tax=unclassified Chryseobacterium TaxID=2593645 RepID=UPI000B083191|nr:MULTISPECIES: hypothetical protein [unclassified Chryseobacterium]
MKKYLLAAAIAVFTMSCNQKKEVENNTTDMSDTVTADTMTPAASTMPQDTNMMSSDSAATSGMKKDSVK